MSDAVERGLSPTCEVHRIAFRPLAAGPIVAVTKLRLKPTSKSMHGRRSFVTRSAAAAAAAASGDPLAALRSRSAMGEAPSPSGEAFGSFYIRVGSGGSVGTTSAVEKRTSAARKPPASLRQGFGGPPEFSSGGSRLRAGRASGVQGGPPCAGGASACAEGFGGFAKTHCVSSQRAVGEPRRSLSGGGPAGR
jgi:hypothetical protein